MRLRLVVVVLAAAAAGCIFFVDPDVQCKQDSDCKGSGQICQPNHICGTPNGDGSSGSSGSTGSDSGSTGTGSTGTGSTTGTTTGDSSSSGTTGIATAGPIGTFTSIPLSGDGARYGPGEMRIGARMYLIGGVELGNVYPVNVVAATLRPDAGSIDFADVGSSLVTGRHHPVIVKLDHDVVVLGGELPDGGVADDESAPILDGGTMGPFTVIPGGLLHVPRYGATMARQNGVVIVMGGVSKTPDGGAGFQGTVESAALGADGGLGPFNITFPSDTTYLRAFFDATALGQSAIAMAGGVNHFLLSDKSITLGIPYADGGASGFGSNTNTTVGHIDGKVFARGGRLHVLSGLTELLGNVTPVNEAFDYTPANGNLTTASQADAPLNEPRAGFVVDEYNGVLYVVGGVSGDAGVNSVNYAPDVEIAPLP
ncbi:MAG: hypothetical protein JST54_03195 [Deltaproteobacteria bacterium]|nr:hypothetical protein [Deltaproteobacteria bacterium]